MYLGHLLAIGSSFLAAFVIPAPDQGGTPGGGGGTAMLGAYRQPWTPPAHSWEARVHSCANPIPFDLAAVDDFSFPKDGKIARLRWWGVLLDPNQANDHPYYVAIYSDNACAPDALLYEACVIPQVEFVDVDCHGDLVFVFSAKIPEFQVTADARYWIQISENDQQSANVGQEDFRWSGRQPVRGCEAGQIDSKGIFHAPLVDVCNDQRDDMSFVIGGKFLP